MVVRLPEEVGKENEDGKAYAKPKPFAPEMAAHIGEQDARDDSNCKDAHRVFGKHTEADRGANAEPPARIVGLQQADHEISGQHPKQVVKRDVLHDRTRAKAERNAGESGNQLRTSTSAHLFGHETGQHQGHALRDRSEKPKARKGWTKQQKRQAAEERSNGRVGDITPGEMASVIEGGQFIAMKAVAMTDQYMHDNREQGEINEQGGVTGAN